MEEKGLASNSDAGGGAKKSEAFFFFLFNVVSCSFEASSQACAPAPVGEF
jgi:hypothetical protein